VQRLPVPRTELRHTFYTQPRVRSHTTPYSSRYSYAAAVVFNFTRRCSVDER
jgi:hypothetical protein